MMERKRERESERERERKSQYLQCRRISASGSRSDLRKSSELQTQLSDSYGSSVCRAASNFRKGIGACRLVSASSTGC